MNDDFDPLDIDAFERRAAERRAGRRKGRRAGRKAQEEPPIGEPPPPGTPAEQPPAEPPPQEEPPQEDPPQEDPPQEDPLPPPPEPAARSSWHRPGRRAPHPVEDDSPTPDDVWAEPAPLPEHLRNGGENGSDQPTVAWAPGFEEDRSRPGSEGTGTEDWERQAPGGGPLARLGSGLGTLRERVGMRSVGGLVALLAGLALIGFMVALWQPFHGDGGDAVVVEIPEGAGVSDIADILADEGVVSSSTLFALRVGLSGKGGEIQAGPYELRQGMSYGAAIDVLATPPSQRTITVTIPEGLSRREVARLVSEMGLEGDYMQASRRSESLDPRDYGAPRRGTLEGFLFPATYELEADATAEELVDQQVAAFVERFREVDLRRAERRNLDAFEVLTIASLIEREVSVPDERDMVSAVISNRLRAGEPLGIDATVRYAEDNWDRPLTQSELESDSRYNTRRFSGLPPGPIGSPGIESIEAAVRPADSRAFYYVVKPNTCNEHVFVETLEEFERARREYNEAREAAGGRAPTTCPDGN